jgi:hypothetical protein
VAGGGMDGTNGYHGNGCLRLPASSSHFKVTFTYRNVSKKFDHHHHHYFQNKSVNVLMSCLQHRTLTECIAPSIFIETSLIYSLQHALIRSEKLAHIGQISRNISRSERRLSSRDGDKK